MLRKINKKDKKQQYLKALKASYIHRRKKLKKTIFNSSIIKKNIIIKNIELNQSQLKNSSHLLDLKWLIMYT